MSSTLCRTKVFEDLINSPPCIAWQDESKVEDSQQNIDKNSGQGRDPAAIWRELYRSVDFEQLARVFLRTHSLTDEDDEGSNHQLLPVTDEDILPNWNKLHSDSDFKAIEAAFLRAFISEPLQEPHGGEDQPTSGQNNIPESTYTLNGQVINNAGKQSSGNWRSDSEHGEDDNVEDQKPPLSVKTNPDEDITNKDLFKVRQWNASTDIHDISEYDVIFFPNNMSMDEMIQKSELSRDADDWLEISAAQPVEHVASEHANANPELTGTVFRAYSSEISENAAAGVEEIEELPEVRRVETSTLPKYTMSILIRKREDVKLEMVLCMQYYQMVWMNIGEVCFVLINCDSKISEYSQSTERKKQEKTPDSLDEKYDEIKKLLTQLNMSLNLGENTTKVTITGLGQVLEDLPPSKMMYEEFKISDVLKRLLKTLEEKKINVVISATQKSPLEKIFRDKRDVIRAEIRTGEFAFCGRVLREETPSSEPFFHFKMCRKESKSIGSAEESDSGIVKVVTWNIDGCTQFCLPHRLEKVCDVLKSTDIILLQEFPPKLLNLFYEENTFPQYTKIFGWRKLGSLQFVYNATMIRTTDHNKGTSLASTQVQDYFLECKTKMKGTYWLLLNCHLLSNISKARHTSPQVSREQSFRIMKQRADSFPNVLIGGDTNQVENETSDKSLGNTLIDVWLHQEPSIQQKYKYTWDPKSNTLHARSKEAFGLKSGDVKYPPARFDRFYLSASQKVHSYEHIGIEEVQLTASTQHLSDHWGVCVEIQISPRI